VENFQPLDYGTEFALPVYRIERFAPAILLLRNWRPQLASRTSTKKTGTAAARHDCIFPFMKRGYQMKRDKKKKNEVKKEREPTSAEISMKAKQGKGAFVENDEDETRIEDIDQEKRASDRNDPYKK